MINEQLASREWWTRAKVRITAPVTAHSLAGERTFTTGQELVMFQWGREGKRVDRLHWWDCLDIDGAFIIDASKVEVLEVLEEVAP